MKSIFSDEYLQSEFEMNGYCVVNLLSKENISEISDLLDGVRFGEDPVERRLRRYVDFAAMTVAEWDKLRGSCGAGTMRVAVLRRSKGCVSASGVSEW